LYTYRPKRQGPGLWPAVALVSLAIAVLWWVGAFDELASSLGTDPLKNGVRILPGIIRSQSEVALQSLNGSGSQPSESGRRPAPTPTPLPSNAIAEQFLNAWNESRYADMYRLLASSARTTYPEDYFIGRYQAIAEEATFESVSATLSGSANLGPQSEGSAISLPFETKIQTALVGEVVELNSLPLALEDGQWRVEWTPSLIFKDLTGENLIRLFPLETRRGNISDRDGRPLATQGFMVVIGVVPGDIEDESSMLSALSEVVSRTSEEIEAAYNGAEPGWFVPVGEAGWEDEQEVKTRLSSFINRGVLLKRRPIRWYPEGPHTAHIVGYVTRITEEQLDELEAKGYSEDDYIGQTGVEVWAEDILAGRRGGKLAIVTRKGEVVKVIAERDAEPGRDIELTLDLEIQKAAEEMLGERPGSITILNPRDNSVLAMATYPRFDPNKFVTGFTSEEWKILIEDEDHPFLARSTNGGYPTGSIFKVVTMSAGIELGGFEPSARFECNGSWRSVGQGQVWRDWKPNGHGELDLRQGLVESCNIVFYDIAAELDQQDPSILPEMARNFGFGASTGIIGLFDSPGIVPDEDWKKRYVDEPWYRGDSVNLGIGQGYLLATPLQVANAYSALAMSGELRTPLLIRRITQPETKESRTLTATTIRRLNVTETTLADIRAAMIKVASDVSGTANYAFNGFEIETAAKTGSAESSGPESHAWFAGYAPANEPRYAVVVMVEGSGTGSETAAPVGRQAFEYLFAAERESTASN
jgi:penicillin-binding protein 2